MNVEISYICKILVLASFFNPRGYLVKICGNTQEGGRWKKPTTLTHFNTKWGYREFVWREDQVEDKRGIGLNSPLIKPSFLIRHGPSDCYGYRLLWEQNAVWLTALNVVEIEKTITFCWCSLKARQKMSDLRSILFEWAKVVSVALFSWFNRCVTVCS